MSKFQYSGVIKMKMYKKYNADIFDAELVKIYAASQSSVPSRYDR